MIEKLFSESAERYSGCFQKNLSQIARRVIDRESLKKDVYFFGRTGLNCYAKDSEKWSTVECSENSNCKDKA